jgi:hypothetical protein
MRWRGMIALISASVGAIAVICDARLHAVCRFVSSSSLACLQTMGVGGFRLWHPSLCGIRHSYFSDSAFSADRISFGRRVQERGQGWMLLESQGGIGNPSCAAVRTREVAPHVGLRWVLQKSKIKVQDSRVRTWKRQVGKTGTHNVNGLLEKSHCVSKVLLLHQCHAVVVEALKVSRIPQQHRLQDSQSIRYVVPAEARARLRHRLIRASGTSSLRRHRQESSSESSAWA